MRIISIGTDRKIFEENSAVRQRNIEYGKFVNEMHVIVFSKRDVNKINNVQMTQISGNTFAYSTDSKSKLFYIWDAFKISRKIYSQDSIVSVGDSFETGIVGVLTKLFLGLPLHVQVHTDLMHKYFRGLSILNELRFFVSEFVLRYADRVRVVSERVKRSIEPFAKNIDVLPIKMEIKTEPAKEIKKPFPLTLLVVCRFEREKNIEAILRAIKSSKNKDIGLCLVGDGSQREDLKQLAKNLEISDKIIFTGWKNNLSPYYKMADVFVSASLYEGYGISTVEAAYFGKPLILSKTGVAEEIFKEGESAFICDAKDEACFARSILSFYEDKNLAEKMGQSAKIAANEHLKSETDYFKEYVDSIIKTVPNFKKRGFISRVFDFKKTIFNSFIALRYFICGITATVVNIGLLYIFTDVLNIWYLYSSILAFLLSLVVSFTMQKFVAFKDMKIDKLHRQFLKYFVAAVFGVTTNTILVFVCVDIIGVWYILSQIIAGFFVMIQNFIFYKFFIFKKK